MDKEKITVTLSLAEFDNLRDSAKSYERLYSSLRNQLQKCFHADMTAYEKALREIDDGPLEKDKDIFRAVKVAKGLIDVKFDLEQLKKVIAKEFDLEESP